MREGEEEETLSSELDDNITFLGGQAILPPKLLPLCECPWNQRRGIEKVKYSTISLISSTRLHMKIPREEMGMLVRCFPPSIVACFPPSIRPLTFNEGMCGKRYGGGEITVITERGRI
jgi:hypothetical protein